MNGHVIRMDPRTEVRSGITILSRDATSAKAQRLTAVGSCVVDSRIDLAHRAASQREILAGDAIISSRWFIEGMGQMTLPLPGVARWAPVRTRRRQAEMAWLERHAAELRALAGEWVAINGEELISHGATAREVLEAARQRGVVRPLLFQVPRTQAEISFAAFD